MNDRSQAAPVAVVLLAAGNSSRMGGEDKLWAGLGGAPLVAHSLRTLGTLPAVTVIAIVAPTARHKALRTLAATLPRSVAVRCVEGGAQRQDSVAAGLAAAPEAGWVLVHDAARPLVSAALAERVLAAARVCGAAIPAVPVADTIKRVTTEDEAGDARVVATLDRSPLRAAQTPQGFDAALLRRAHALAASAPGTTDDAALVERLGLPVAVVSGEPQNLKVTTPGDLAIVRALLAALDGS